MKMVMKLEDNTKSTRHAKYNLNYHFVWIPKYRKPALKGKRADRVRDLLEEIAEQKEFEVLEMEIMDDHTLRFFK